LKYTDRIVNGLGYCRIIWVGFSPSFSFRKVATLISFVDANSLCPCIPPGIQVGPTPLFDYSFGRKQVIVLALAGSKEALHDFDAYGAPVSMRKTFCDRKLRLTMKCKNFADKSAFPNLPSSISVEHSKSSTP